MPIKDFTKITQKNKKYYDVRVKSRNGFDPTEDSVTRKSLEKIAAKFGGFSNGSGYCFLDGERDFGFCFPSKLKAYKFAKQAVESKLIKVKVRVCEALLGWEYGDSCEINYKKIM